jgi:uncharacterized delta-60 repeat protein
MKEICFGISFALTLLTLTGDVAARPRAGQGTLLWWQHVNGTANSFFDAARSVAVDNQGNVVAAGFTENAGVFTDFTVAKFDRGGTLLWQQNLNGTANGFDLAFSVAVDNQGNVVAAGVTQNTNTGAFADFTVAKFARDGTLLWQQNLNGTVANSVNRALSVAVDNQGNVVAAGETQNTGTSLDFTVAKFARDGTLLWQQNLNGTANGSDRASSVAVDNQGNVIAAGLTENIGTSLDFTVAKFARDGTLLWQQNLNGTANGNDVVFSPGSVAVDNQGNVIAAGITENTGTSFDFTVAKFDRDGALLWQQNLNGIAPNSSDEAFSVAVDHQGNVVAAGHTGADLTVAKFDRDGTLLWEQNLNGGSASSVTVDNQGNVVVAGETQNTGTSLDFTVAKFARDGTLLWQQNLNGTADGEDAAFSVAVDNQGNVVAAGDVQNTGTSRDFTVAKFGR